MDRHQWRPRALSAKPDRARGDPSSMVFTKVVLGDRTVEPGRYVSVHRRSNSLTAQYSALAFAHEAAIFCSVTGWRRCSLK